jgi:hypothetical protein
MKKVNLISAVLLLACVVQVLGQDRQVSGTVSCSDDSTPLSKVSVVLKGTTIGTASGEDGKFSLTIPEYYSTYNTLCFSHIGMKSCEIEMVDCHRGKVNVGMEPDIISLTEVTIVYDTLTGQSWTYLTKIRHDGEINMMVHFIESPQAEDHLRNLR